MEVKCCETCENKNEDRFKSPCSRCSLNDKFISHYKEAAAVTAYKERKEERDDR
ncbi:MAG: hypothetical protein IKF99_09910 [Oscillospiraceae bacterium]|nr:hypothetical protein [Oscillospiraceae bacterium]